MSSKLVNSICCERGDRLKIQLMGDSIIARHEGSAEPMINCLLKNKFPNLIIYNTAVAGNNTCDLLRRLDSDVLSVRNVDKIFVLIGINDAARNKQVSLDRYAQNLEKIINQLLKRYCQRQIYFITPPAVDERKQRYRDNQLIATYVNKLERVVKQNHCHFLNLFEALSHHPNFPKIMQGSLNDGLHFGEGGYQVLAKLISQCLVGSKGIN